MKLTPWHLAAVGGLAWTLAKLSRNDTPTIGATFAANPRPNDPINRKDFWPTLYVWAHDATLIQPTMQAAARIKKASGITIIVNKAGTIFTAFPIFMSQYMKNTGKGGWTAPGFIAMAKDFHPEWLEKAIIHELFHHLGVAHLEPPKKGLMLGDGTAGYEKISSDDLKALCAVKACTVFKPEVVYP